MKELKIALGIVLGAIVFIPWVYEVYYNLSFGQWGWAFADLMIIPMGALQGVWHLLH